MTFLLSMCYSNSFADECDYPGWYRWKEGTSDWCMPCPQGCYCPKAADDMERAPSKWMDCKEGLTKHGIHKCDDGWTTNKVTDILHDRTYEQGAMSSDDCYFVAKDTGKKVKDGRACIEVSAGKYIKAGYEQVQDCKEGYICPGKYLLDSKGNDLRGARAKDAKWDPNTGLSKQKTMCRSPNYDAGIYLCPSGTKANSSHTACEKKEETINCKAGQYLPKNATSCRMCKPRYYLCIGGTFPLKPSSDQGIKKCNGNLIADSGHKQCVADTSSSTSKTTTSETTTPKTTTTKIIISKPQMSQCWQESGDAENFKSCVLLANSSTNTITYTTTPKYTHEIDTALQKQIREEALDAYKNTGSAYMNVGETLLNPKRY